MNRKSGRQWLIGGLLALAAGATGVAGVAVAQSDKPMSMMMHGGHSTDPAAMAAHFDKMMATMVPDATAEQKARLKAIAESVHKDLGGIHAQFRQTHERAHALLLAPKVDRAGLEQLRAAQMAQMDATSKRVLTALADAAEVLTPEQRARLGEQMKAHEH